MFIAVDLKVIEGLSDAVARSAGVGRDRALAGLVRLWHRCWADEADVFTADELAGILGARRIDRFAASLVSFGFLEPTGEAFRVKGGDRYLRIRESRRRGGKASAKHLKRGNQSQLNPSSRAGSQPGLSPSSTPALSVLGVSVSPRTTPTQSALGEDVF